MLDATDLAKLIQARKISAVDIVKASLDSMAQLEPELNAFCTPTPELAIKRAHEIDLAIARGEPVGPLAGIPIAVKDLICTEGIRTTSGSVIYQDFVPDEDDIVIERIKAAGAIIVGKTTAPEFGYSGVGHNPLFPSPRNPWNTDLTPGGSSAGSGVAVASHMCPVALGSDGGGSVRIPASFCGLYGFKPSMGRIPLYPGCRDERYPGMSSWESLEHIGPMTRSVRDASLMMSVLAGSDRRDRHSIPSSDVQWSLAASESTQGKRVAFSIDWGYAVVDAEVRDIITKAAKIFENELGCIVDEAHPGFSNPAQTFAALVAMDSDLEGLRKLKMEFGTRMSPHLNSMLSREWRAEDFTNAIRERKRLVNQMWRFMDQYDFLITPTLATPPFALGMQGPEVIDGEMVTSDSWNAFCFPINFTGQPAASIPAGFTRSGLPVGLQIVGRHLDDIGVIKLSEAFERVNPWQQHIPTIVKRH
jgi:aspartyl-tRNA(Asn)/glutamyl-tRNA(Gln) amidotransferase subunit A